MKRQILMAAMLLIGMTATAQSSLGGILSSLTSNSYDKDSEVVQISVRHPGDLNQKLTPNDRRYVTKLIIDGLLNDDDYRVISELARRTRMVDNYNKEVNAYIDIDLSGAQYKVGDRVTNNLPAGAFSGATNLRSIVLPSKMTEIANSTFSGCRSLQAVELPQTLRVIGSSAFYGTALTSITLPRSVEKINNSAFGDTQIENAFIGANIQACPINAFDNPHLMNIDVEKGSRIYSSRDGVLCSPDGTVILNYPRGRQGAYTIPQGVTSFSENAFHANRGLTAVTLPESITELPEGAFEECSALAQVNIPGKITLIPKNAFRGCKALLDFTIPENIQYIGPDAFRACKGMRTLSLPSALKTIEEYAFAYCEKLIKVEIPASVISVGNKAFYHCDAMVEMSFLAPNPPAMDKVNDNPKKLIVKVPQGSQAAYSALESFKKHKVTE